MKPLNYGWHSHEFYDPVCFYLIRKDDIMRFYFLPILALLLTVACSNEKTTTFSVPFGGPKVTATEEGGKEKEIKVETDKGSMTIKSGNQSIPQDLGVPLYPGAQTEISQNWNMEKTGLQGQSGMNMVFLHSKDSIDAVAAYYKAQLKDKSPHTMDLDMGDGRMVNLMIEGSDHTQHMIGLHENKKEGGTDITISKIKK